LSPAAWSALIAKVQAGNVPVLTPSPLEIVDPVPVSDPTPLTNFFTVEASTFSIDPDPSALPDCLIQMALNRIFIPLSMLTTITLNNIETNQNINASPMALALARLSWTILLSRLKTSFLISSLAKLIPTVSR